MFLLMRYLVKFVIIILCNSFIITQVIKTKDNVILGLRNDFVSSCASSTEQEIIDINGYYVNTTNYCECVSDSLIPTLYSFEIEKAIKNDKMMDLFLNEKNLKIIMTCVEGNVTFDDDFILKDEYLTEIGQKAGINNCVAEIMSDPDIREVLSTKAAEDYCACAVNKLFSLGYTYKDYLELENEDSEVFNETILPCLDKFLYDLSLFESNAIYNSDDIIGNDYSSNIPLVNYYEQGYKVKISIDGISKYYLLDTGASNLIINRDVERDLLINGSLTKKDYLGTELYSLANNQNVTAQLVRLNNIKIGEYVVNNVTAAIIDDGSLLCGIGLLEKFRKWELDNGEEMLILYR